MKQEVLITVNSIFETDGEHETTEFFTNGLLYLKNQKYYLLYEAFHEHEQTTKTTIIVEHPNKLCLKNSGSSNYHLLLEQNVRCQGFFSYGGAQMIMGINPTIISSNLSEQGGDIHMKYALETGGVVMTQNEVKINIKIKPTQED